MLLFNEPQKAIASESTAKDNKIDNLIQDIDDAAKKMADDQSKETESADESEPSGDHPNVQGEGPNPHHDQGSSFQGEKSSPNTSSSTEIPTNEGDTNAGPEQESFFEGKNTNVGDDDILSELEEEINAELDPIYDPNFPPLIKWTKYHPQSQIIGESSETSLQGTADSNAERLDSLVNKMATSVASELQSFASLRQSLSDDNNLFKATIEERLTKLHEDLASENSVMDALARKTTALKDKSLHLFHSQKEVESLGSEHEQLVQSLVSSSRHSEISCGRFWSLITNWAMDRLRVPLMADSLLSSIATFHTTKIIVTDPTKFSFIGSIPEALLGRIAALSNVLQQYRKRPSVGPRELTPTMIRFIEEADKPTKRGKKPETQKEGPSDDDDDELVTKCHLKVVNEKLDQLLSSSSSGAYSEATLKALFSSVVTEHSATLSAAAEAIEASTSQCQQAYLAVDASTKECKEATEKVDKLVSEAHLFLDSSHVAATKNAQNVNASVENLQRSLQSERSNPEAARQAIEEANETLHANVNDRLTQMEAELAVENRIMDELDRRTAQLKLQTHKLRTANAKINDLKSEREVIRSSTTDVHSILLHLIEAHDPIITITVRRHLADKLRTTLDILSSSVSNKDKKKKKIDEDDTDNEDDVYAENPKKPLQKVKTSEK
ncbi:uncharacterized protein LOC128134244 [Lactuca sativa]|uniref:uncharacterized protein LOC128134244 n=1 Tax=Lactuca sativa TaxID=4236 RepID=UPI0022AFA032|nr:uncharacterized protein LOC128134244 [Lactuca sativa]